MSKKSRPKEPADAPRAASESTKALPQRLKNFALSGQVRSRQTQAGVAGLRVEVWHHLGPLNQILLRTATSDAQGDFHFPLSSFDFQPINLPSKLNLFFKIYFRDELLTSTEDALLRGVSSDQKGILIEVDLPKEKQRVLTGRLRDTQSGQPLVGCVVSAQVTNTNPPADLGAVMSSGEKGKEGEFTLVYTGSAVTASRAFKLDLIIRDPQGREASIPGLVVTGNEPFEVRVKFPAAVRRLQAGEVGAELHFDQAAAQKLFAAAATRNDQGTQLWATGDSELLVATGQVKVKLDDGLVLITIPVSCEQTGSVAIQVPFAVGGKDQPAGLLFAAPERLSGPTVIVDLWGEALTAFAWQTFVTVASQAAGTNGVDEDGAGLIPVAITATPDGLRVQTMARHSFDRVRQ